jgi:hypothetical protein
MTTIEQLEENQRDIIAVLQWLGATKTPTEKIAGALRRLSAQLPQPEAATRPQHLENVERRKELLARERQPLRNGMVLPPMSVAELEQQKQYKQQEAERKAQTARPSLPPNVPRKVAM